MLPEVLHQGRELLGSHEEFQVGFLVHVTILGSPSEDRMVRLDSVDRGLTIDGQVAAMVELDQLLADTIGLLGQGLVAPREHTNLTRAIEGKRFRNLLHALGRLPEFKCFFFLQRESVESTILRSTYRVFDCHTVTVKFTKSGRTTVTPASVREFIPRLRSQDIGTCTVLPEDGTNIFVETVLGQRLRNDHIEYMKRHTGCQGKGFAKSTEARNSKPSKIKRTDFSKLRV